MSYNFSYSITPELFKLFEKSPRLYFQKIKNMNKKDIFNHLNDYEKNNNYYHGNNALHCLCMIMSSHKPGTTINKNYGINTICDLDLGIEILVRFVQHSKKLSGIESILSGKITDLSLAQS